MAALEHARAGARRYATLLAVPGAIAVVGAAVAVARRRTLTPPVRV